MLRPRHEPGSHGIALAVVESVIALRVLFRALPSQEEGFVRFIYAINPASKPGDKFKTFNFTIGNTY